MTTPTTLWADVRNHIDTEVRVLTWIQADATDDGPASGSPDENPGTTATENGAREEGSLEPTLADLDSFTFIQLVLSIEAEFDVELLEDLGEFQGESFDDVADFVSRRIESARAGAGPA